MTTKPNFVFVDVPERPKANSIAVKRQRLIEGLTKQAAEVKRFEQGHWTPRNWFWSDDSGKFYLEVRYAKKPLVISEGKSAILCQSLEDVAAVRRRMIWNSRADLVADGLGSSGLCYAA